MTGKNHYRPPRLAEWLLKRLLPSGIRGESILGDLLEEHRDHSVRDGSFPAALWYWRRSYQIGRRYAWPQRLRESPLSVVSRSPFTVRIGRPVGAMMQDLRFGMRSLRKRPAFTVISILTLGLGIGATTAIFSVVDGVLIRDLPYRDPDRLVSIWKAWPSWRGVDGLNYAWDHIQFPWVDYQNVQNSAASLSEVAAFSWTNLMLTSEGEPEPLVVGRASANFFDLLGVRPVLGRPFLEEEVPPSGPAEGARVALLSHELWNRRFGGDRVVVGLTILLNGDAYEVVGVLPASFRIGSDLIRTFENGGDVDAGHRDVWIPLRQRSDDDHTYELLARLAPGASVEQARAEVQTLMTGGPEDQQARVVTRKEFVTEGFGKPLLLLLGAAGILLVVACVNVAGLLVGEAPGRCHEFSVRCAIGAGRGRVVRQLLTENVFLGLLGSALGVVLAWVGTEAMLSVAPPLPRLEEVRLSGQVLLFACCAGVATGMMFGLAPIITFAGRSISTTLGSRGQSAGRGSRSLQATVVSVQVALTVVLLVAGGLLGRSLRTLLAVDPGFNAEGLLSVEVALSDRISALIDGGESTGQTNESLLGEVVRAAENVAGVSTVSGADYVPFRGGTWTSTVHLELHGHHEHANHYIRHVLPNYHELMGIPLRSGRLFTRADGFEDPRVMLVSEGIADRYWPGESPVGASATKGGETWTIVGVVGDVRKQALGTSAEPTFYFPALQNIPRASFSLVLSTAGDPGTVLPFLRKAIRSVDPTIWIGTPTALPSLMKNSESDDRFRTVLMLTLSALATVLAAVGIYGVTARSVAARTREMGVRMALGAKEARLIRLILRDSMLSATIGAAVGLLGAFWATHLFEHFLFGVDSLDPVTYASVFGFLMFVCFGAAYVPARQVKRIALMEVIAEE